MTESKSSPQPGRPREFEFDEVLSQIMNLFWEQGYEATGLSDIIKATGLGKASLYSAFGNKQSMYLMALDHYESLAVDGAVAVLKSPDQLPFERINTYLSFPIKAVEQENDLRGCFLCNASADRASLDEDTGKTVRKGYDKMRRALVSALTDALPDATPETILSKAQLALTVYSGLRVIARSRTDVSALIQAKDACMAAIGE